MTRANTQVHIMQNLREGFSLLWRTAAIAVAPTALTTIFFRLTDTNLPIVEGLLKILIAWCALTLALYWQNRSPKISAPITTNVSNQLRFTYKIAAWSSLGIAYLVFWSWYNGNGTPMTAIEIDKYVDRFEDSPLIQSDPALLDRMRNFAESDDGRELLVINLVKPVDNRTTVPDPRAGLAMARKLFSLGGHPVASADVQSHLVSAVELPDWSSLSMVRYRSRRDFLEATTSDTFLLHALSNGPEYENTVKLITTPRLGLWLGARSIVFLLFVGIGVLIHRRLSSSEDVGSENRTNREA